MGWGDLIGGFATLAGTAYSIYSGEQTRKTAEQQAKAAADAMDKQSALSAEQAKLAREQWTRYTTMYGPLETAQIEEQLYDLAAWRPYKNELLNQTRRDLERRQDYEPIEDAMIQDAINVDNVDRYRDRASADVAQSFDRNRDMAQRDMSRMGINPNSGRWQGQERTMALSEALAGAGGRTQAALNAETEARNVRGAALNFRQGYPMPQQQASTSGAYMSGQALAGLQGATAGMGGVASGHAGLAGMAGQNMNQAMQGVGYGIGMMTQGPQRGGINWSGIQDTVGGWFS